MSKEFELSIYTPKRLFFNGEILQLNITIAHGAIGLLADHIPLISSIKTSFFSIEGKRDRKKVGIINGGIIFFENNKAKIFTSKIIWKENINPTNLKEKVSHYQEKLGRTDLGEYERQRLEKNLKFFLLQK